MDALNSLQTGAMIVLWRNRSTEQGIKTVVYSIWASGRLGASLAWHPAVLIAWHKHRREAEDVGGRRLPWFSRRWGCRGRPVGWSSWSDAPDIPGVCPTWI